MESPASDPNPDVLNGRSPEDIDRLDEIWLAVIERVEQRIWYAETRRSSFATLAGGLLAAGIALLTAILINETALSYRPAFWSLLCLSLGAFGTGAVVFIVYARQTNYDYPFKKNTTTWKWFYRDALGEGAHVRVPWHTMETGSQRNDARNAFDQGWKAFAVQQVEALDRTTNALQDLQQLYVLHVNEFYKNRFLTQIRKVVAWGLALTVLAALAGLFISMGTRSTAKTPAPKVTQAGSRIDVRPAARHGS